MNGPIIKTVQYKKMKNYLMTMDLVLIVIIKIIFVSVDRKIVLVLLLEKALDGD